MGGNSVKIVLPCSEKGFFSKKKEFAPGIYLKRKEFAPCGSKFFPFMLDFFSDVD